MSSYTEVYRIERKAVYAGACCHGNVFWDRLTGENPHGCKQPGPMGVEQLIGHQLGNGSVVRVTIEVLHEQPMGDRCVNTISWHKGDHRRLGIPENKAYCSHGPDPGGDDGN